MEIRKNLEEGTVMSADLCTCTFASGRRYVNGVCTLCGKSLYAAYTVSDDEEVELTVAGIVAAINRAADMIGATTWSPEQWGDRNADAYAVTLAPFPGVVMVNTDTVDLFDVTAYAYRADSAPTNADDVMPALMADDGASLDPIAELSADVYAGDIATALQRAITDAFSHFLANMSAPMLRDGEAATPVPNADRPAVEISGADFLGYVVRYESAYAMETDGDEHVTTDLNTAIAFVRENGK